MVLQVLLEDNARLRSKKIASGRTSGTGACNRFLDLKSALVSRKI